MQGSHILIDTFVSQGLTYPSANTALESLISRHRNAFCLVTPMVLDTSIAFGDLSKGSTRNVKVRHIAAWGVSCRGNPNVHIFAS